MRGIAAEWLKRSSLVLKACAQDLPKTLFVHPAVNGYLFRAGEGERQ